MNYIRRAVVCQFCSPFVVLNDFKKDISTADVLRNNGVWLDEVQIVETESHVKTNGLQQLRLEVLLCFQ